MPPSGWALIWADEFDGDSLDYDKWNAQDGPSPRNGELQYYTPNNIEVGGGRLRLVSERFAFQDRSYTSAAIDTHGKFTFTYGRVEIRARLPGMGQGIWPALWMLGTECHPSGSPCPWPTAGAAEIDIMEAVNTPTTVFTNLHYGVNIGESQSDDMEQHSGANYADGYHRFAIEWESGGRVRWYLDGTLAAERAAPGHLEAPMYLLINTAIGGNWPGAPDASTPFPQRFDIDYVRVYQRS